MIFTASILLSGQLAFAHPGRLDSNGGHRNRATGEYHYHNSGTTTTTSSGYTTPSVTPSTTPSVTPIKVYINGTVLNSDQAPVISEGRVLVPLRPIMEALGANVDWDSQTEKVNAQKQNTTLILQVGKNYGQCNGTQITVDTPPKIISGRVLVPARVISESFGASVSWDNTNRKVTITY